MFTSITVAVMAIAAAVIAQFFLRSDWNMVRASDSCQSVESNRRTRSTVSSIQAAARQLTFKTIVILLAVVVAALAQTPEGLRGSVGKDPRWNSGWIDFAQPTSFYKGDQLRLTVGGTATKVVVRLLDDPRRADSSEGVIGVFTVGADRIVRITLDVDYRGIQQISVHGGPNPWNLYDLGGGNGAWTSDQLYKQLNFPHRDVFFEALSATIDQRRVQQGVVQVRIDDSPPIDVRLYWVEPARAQSGETGSPAPCGSLESKSAHMRESARSAMKTTWERRVGFSYAPSAIISAAPWLSGSGSAPKTESR